MGLFCWDIFGESFWDDGMLKNVDGASENFDGILKLGVEARHYHYGRHTISHCFNHTVHGRSNEMSWQNGRICRRFCWQLTSAEILFDQSHCNHQAAYVMMPAVEVLADITLNFWNSGRSYDQRMRVIKTYFFFQIWPRIQDITHAMVVRISANSWKIRPGGQHGKSFQQAWWSSSRRQPQKHRLHFGFTGYRIRIFFFFLVN